MTAWAFTSAYQEALMLPYWVRWYRTFCERVVVYVDTDSTDGSAELARAEGAEVRPCGGTGTFDDIEAVQDAETAVMEAAGHADWAIWTDADELLWHPDPAGHLARLKDDGMTVPRLVSSTIVADHEPSHPGQIFDRPEFRRGLFLQGGLKVAIFDPNRVRPHWEPGKHAARWDGPVREDDGADPFRILHYRLFGPAHWRARNALRYARLSQRNRDLKLGFHVDPTYAGPYDPGWAGPGLDGATDVLTPALVPA